MSRPRISIFFGAGAEIPYGLPSGGRFALNIFREDPDVDRTFFKEQLKSIDPLSIYASEWLPDKYADKRVQVFGKSEFENIITSSLEYRREAILDYFDNFDDKILDLLNGSCVPFDELRLRQAFKTETGFDLGSISYNQQIKLNPKLAPSVSVFGSMFFSAFLRVLDLSPTCISLRKVLQGLLELLIGAFGQRLVSDLNEDLFEKAPDISLFDEITGIFSLSYANVGQTSMQLVLEGKNTEINHLSGARDLFSRLGQEVLADILSVSLDYQALIDSHFRYLYEPRAQWAKFTRVAIFLSTVRRYIVNQEPVDPERLRCGPGYYHDLQELNKGEFELISVGTTNYNNLCMNIVRDILDSSKVYHLNGNVDEYYDPYINQVHVIKDHEELKMKGRILVPFIFTQSGVKPLTSVGMSRRYVDMFDSFKQSDVICCVGYGFNGDDGHINGLLRTLVEDEGKKLVVLHYDVSGIHGVRVSSLRQEYQKKLRLSSDERLAVLVVDKNRYVGDQVWYQALINQYETMITHENKQ